ncbi:MAG: hypothetical protein N3A69_05400 [Leptospiraceae bacterium]|nr:hypothetical protein [Leptospiraceae bacterium]
MALARALVNKPAGLLLDDLGALI